jgi:hypothetical protein
MRIKKVIKVGERLCRQRILRDVPKPKINMRDRKWKFPQINCFF